MKLIVMCMIIGMTSVSFVDAYNFRSKKKQTKSYQNMMQNQEVNRINYNSENSYHRSSSNLNQQGKLQKSGFGFEEFNSKPVQQNVTQKKQIMNTSRNMSRGPQRRMQNKRPTYNPPTHKKSQKLAYATKEQTPQKIQGYKGEFYGGGNALFQVDPGLIGRWSKPGLRSKKQNFIK